MFLPQAYKLFFQQGEILLVPHTDAVLPAGRVNKEKLSFGFLGNSFTGKILNMKAF